ncbi:protein of unknown function [Candidatus Methylocalor cossyra]|uniref:Uncharacterized protein n=1 Tax=Candidatus Methylocalor cossyra TaxID=3108543 RepID=A0ABM9NEV4_9GAMM
MARSRVRSWGSLLLFQRKGRYGRQPETGASSGRMVDILALGPGGGKLAGRVAATGPGGSAGRSC